MKETFARIFELPDHQVLITKIDAEEDIDSPFKVVQTTLHRGVKADISLCYAEEEKRDEIFQTYNENNAESFVVTVIKFVDDNT